jgi:hypothetical protein
MLRQLLLIDIDSSMLKKISFILIIALTGCARFKENPNLLRSSNTGSGGAFEPLECNLRGAWTRCTSTGPQTSIKTVIKASGAVLSGTTFEFLSSQNCAGDEDKTTFFDMQFEMGKLGEATSVPGGTQLVLTPTSNDLFGCGVGVPSYTVIRFYNDCQNFSSSTAIPSCDMQNSPAVLDAEAFNRL